MATIQSIQKAFGGNLCRRCINTQYGARLWPRDCKYDRGYPRACACCGERRNIVCGLSPFGKIKLLFKNM